MITGYVCHKKCSEKALENIKKSKFPMNKINIIPGEVKKATMCVICQQDMLPGQEIVMIATKP